MEIHCFSPRQAFSKDNYLQNYESVNEQSRLSRYSIFGLILAISVRFQIEMSQDSSLVDSGNLTSVADFGRYIIGCPNLRYFFLADASATANLMEVDPGIDENTSRHSFRVSEGS